MARRKGSKRNSNRRRHTTSKRSALQTALSTRARIRRKTSIFKFMRHLPDTPKLTVLSLYTNAQIRRQTKAKNKTADRRADLRRTRNDNTIVVETDPLPRAALAPRAPRVTRTKKELEVFNNNRRKTRNSKSMREPCVEKPDSKRAAETRWRLAGRPSHMLGNKYGFRNWCK